MIDNILQLLEIAKSENAQGKYIDVALGKNKLPESLKEAYKQFKRGLWQR
tara:strand:+ start:359 stop:508 length:150 start_codon:yes stop_codon:yes gene_type:complete